MKRLITALATAAVIATATLAVAATAAPLSTPTLKKTIASNGKPTLIFFENPNGGPCKAQKTLLDKLVEQRKENFNIASVSTLRQEDQKGFYDYGIRSLPTLVLVDKAGKISRVFSPGIQNTVVLSSALDGLK